MNEGYSVCLNKWALDQDIKNELNLLLIISSLCAEKGYCFASNKYFADIFSTSELTISRKIKKLSDKGYISIEYIKTGSVIKQRNIRLSKMITDHYQKSQWTIIKNDKDNNISINNISINKKENIIKERFKKPTLEEIQNYINERHNQINANTFYNFYESKGWMVGKNKMKDWKACIRTWEAKDKKKEAPHPSWLNKTIDDEKDGVSNESKEFAEKYLK